MNNTKILSNDRLCKAFTGLSVQEFENLVPDFEWNLREAYGSANPKRKRKQGGGRKGKLPTAMDKLIFILNYLKCYPTYDFASVLWDLDRSRCCRRVQFLLPVLEKTLGRKLQLPDRHIRSIEEFLEKFPELKDVFIDGTERRVQRPISQKRRKKLYSGKKKTTTRKNVVVSDEERRILVLSPTKTGRRHDKRLTDKMGAEHIPKEITTWTDTGLIGIRHCHANIMMPKRASKNHPLTEEEKQENRLISSIRVVSEHAISGIKRMRCVSDVYRNRLSNLDDTFILLSAGLWNYHLDMVTVK